MQVTPREKEILHLVAEGQLFKSIAHSLGLSVKTIDKHMDNVRTRNNAKTTTHAVVMAIKAGLVK